jgi:hypothetical protein
MENFRMFDKESMSAREQMMMQPNLPKLGTVNRYKWEIPH